MKFWTLRGRETSDIERDAKTRCQRLTMGVVALVTLAAFSFMEVVALTQWLSGRWYLADVGNIHYCLFNTLHGQFMASPLVGGANHFAYHFTPFLLLLLPIVGLCPYPVPLVSSYVLALAVCLPVVFAMARQEGISRGASLALGWLFLANHFTGSLELANHFESFYVLLALVCLLMRESHWLPVAGLLAMSVKEDAAAWLAGWALIEWWCASNPADRQRYRRFVLVAAVYLALAATIMFLLQRAQGAGALKEYGPRFAGCHLGADTLLTALTLLASFAFLPLLAGRRLALLLLPLPLLVSNFPFMRGLLYYYSYPFLPFLGYTAVLGYRRIEGWLTTRRLQRVLVWLPWVIFGLGLAQWFLPTRTDGYRRLPFEVTPRDRYRFEIAATRLPRHEPVAIQFGLWGITPHRSGAHFLSPKELRPTDWVFMDFLSPHGLEREAFIALARDLLGQVQRGEREALHSAHDIFVITPVKSAEEHGQ